MFQFSASGSSFDNYFYINLYDEMIKNDYELTQEPIFSIVSQQTGKEKLFYPYSMDTTNYKRYYKFRVKYVATETEPLFTPINGWIALNNQNFPYGLYDLKIYQNAIGYTTLTLDNVIKLVYSGLLNVTPLGNSVSVEYTEYTTNDSDTESVYITN